MDRQPRHTFSICAYGCSPYLEQCISSVLSQDTPGDVIICTSTDNEHIRALAKRYGIPLYVRSGQSSLRDDWNYAMRTATEEREAELVTIAHQDDIYHPGYRRALLEACRRWPDMSLFCTRYETIDAEGHVIPHSIEGIKRILRMPLRLRGLSGTRFIKELPIRFGNGICCPSCSYAVKLTGTSVFSGEYSFVTDWDALIRLARRPGRFICDERELISYRVHEGAATSRLTHQGLRGSEEELMFRKLWPAPIASLLMIPYRRSYRMYE